MTEDFQRALSEALRRRLYPNSPLRLKQLAGAIGRSENTMARWCRGETRITAEDLNRLAKVLTRRGDSNFLAELFDDLAPAKVPADVEQTVLGLVRGALAHYAKEGSAREKFLWFKDDGAMIPAPQGHAPYAARMLRLPPAGPEGPVEAALRLKGWIAVTVHANGALTVRHDGHGIAVRAAERACDWLLEHVDRATAVTRAVHVDGGWVEAGPEPPASAIAVIEKVALVFTRPRRPWTVTRLSLDAVENARLRELLRINRQTPAKIVHAAAAIGALTTSSVLRVEGDDVIVHHVATDFDFGHVAVEGHNVLARADIDYALMIRARMLLTSREGPTYHELSGTVDNHYVRYLNLALPEGGSGNRVLSSTVVLEGRSVTAG